MGNLEFNGSSFISQLMILKGSVDDILLFDKNKYLEKKKCNSTAK